MVTTALVHLRKEQIFLANGPLSYQKRLVRDEIKPEELIQIVKGLLADQQTLLAKVIILSDQVGILRDENENLKTQLDPTSLPATNPSEQK